MCYVVLKLVKPRKHRKPSTPSSLSSHLPFLPCIQTFFPRRLLVWTESIFHPSEQASCGVLGERVSKFSLLNRGIGVSNESRRYQDGRSWGESNNKTHIPENEVSSEVWVERTKRCDGAPTPCKICGVGVGESDGSRAKVERGGTKDGVRKVSSEVAMFCTKGTHCFVIVLIEEGCKGRKQTCTLVSSVQEPKSPKLH